MTKKEYEKRKKEFKKALKKVDPEAWKKFKAICDKKGWELFNDQINNTYSRFINGSFYWEDTNEGYDYWRQIWHEIM